MKRFWARAEVAAREQGFAVLLDGKPVNVPDAGPLLLANAELAEAIAAEWRDVGESFGPDDLPLTRLASTARHRVPGRRAELVAALVAYGLNDLLCYRAEDAALAAHEAAAWDSWLAWAVQHLSVTLKAGAGLAHIPQAPEAGADLTIALYALTDAALAGLGVIVPALGSLVLGRAILAGALDPATACNLAEVDALWQESRWGADAEATARRRAIAADVAAAARFMILCKA